MSRNSIGPAVALLALGVLAAGCEREPTDDAIAELDVPARGSVELTIVGGPLAGTHSATGNVSCFVTGTTWGASFEDETVTEPDELRMVLASIENVPAEGGSSEQFNIGATWGDPTDAARPGQGPIMVNTATPPAGGTGTVVIERADGMATIRVDSRLPDGTAVTSTIRCAVD